MTAEPAALPRIEPGDQLTELQVVRTGLRGGQTKRRPNGWPAAECHCSCGTTGIVVPFYRLRDGHVKSCCHLRNGTVEDTIIAYVRRRRGAWFSEIMQDLGLTTGQAGGHLSRLVRADRLRKSQRGWYTTPRQRVQPRPRMSERTASRNKTVWAGLGEAERQRRVDALTAGRKRRVRESNPRGLAPNTLSRRAP